jgi:hypothetical protein
MEKILTLLPEDTFGISKIFTDYMVETNLHKIGDLSTKVEISHFYSTRSLTVEPDSKEKDCTRDSGYAKCDQSWSRGY